MHVDQSRYIRRYWIDRFVGGEANCYCSDIICSGFEYDFDAIENESDELFSAYKEMFEVAISQNDDLWEVANIWLPILNTLLASAVLHFPLRVLNKYVTQPSKAHKTVKKCQETIHRVAGRLIADKKRKIAECETEGKSYTGKDLLSLLCELRYFDGFRGANYSK
jgi:hypothetical protein